MAEVKTVSQEVFLAHIETMKAQTGHDGSAPRSSQPKTNVREFISRLETGSL